MQIIFCAVVFLDTQLTKKGRGDESTPVLNDSWATPLCVQSSAAKITQLSSAGAAC